MNVSKWFWFVLAVIAAVITGCAFPFQDPQSVELSDISQALGYNSISRQGFMGGSVLYNPDQPSSGQLVKGAHVAVRLGKVDRQDVDVEQSVFTDKAGEARYGYITVNAVDKDRIDFAYTQYSADGRLPASSQYTVTLDEKADINGDGLMDITYTKPVRKRSGMENAVYLTFLSSQETLNTSMFAVLPEQYSRGVYPSGIIGINIDGKFLVSKYEGNTSTRSAVLGVMKGDFVLDAVEGDYQRIVSTSPSHAARSISDSELEDIESSDIIVSYRFTESDFAYGYDAELLFSALPDTVKNLYTGSELFLEKLNRVLENRELVLLVSREWDTSITEDKFAEVRAQIALLSDEEVVQLNRVFLDIVYPDVSPQFTGDSDGIAEVLGLACVVVGGDLDESPEGSRESTRAAVKASSSADYDNRFRELDTWFKGRYKEVLSKTLPIKFSDNVSMTLNNSFVKIGLYGTFTCVWGHVGGSVEGVVYLNTDTNLQSTVTFNKDLINLTQSISVPVFQFGPIVLTVGGELNESINLNVVADLSTAFKFRAAFAGIYGGGVEAGVKYGTTTKKVKILFVTLKILAPYIDGYSGSWSVEKAIYYAGSDSPTSLTFKNLKATLTPQVKGSIKADVSGCLHGKITAQEGLPSSVTVKYEKPYLTGTAEIREKRRLYAEASFGVEIDIPILGKKTIGPPSKQWDLVPAVDRPLQTWQLFKTKVN